LVTLKGVRPIRVRGTGLVTGLQGTGDEAESARKAVQRLLARQNINVNQADVEGENVAVVAVTAEIPPFARPGVATDVRVSSLHDAESLENGTLVRTNLRARTDGPIYAVASGRVLIGGEGAENRFGTTGGIPNGAQIVRSHDTQYLTDMDTVELLLKRPSFSDAANIAKVINSSDTLNPDLEAYLSRLGFDAVTRSIPGPAQALDAGTVIVKIPDSYRQRKVQYVSSVLQTPVDVDVPARVVINRATNTVVITGQVKVSRAAIAHGDLRVLVERPEPREGVPQPPQIVHGPQAEQRLVEMAESLGQTENLQVLLNTLNAMQTRPRDVITIIENLHKAGALHAELVVE